ncbi:MAG TPA: YceD family protein [Nevskiaceae bacterium]|nr:YceD family protein [Nevskiaceae bacterium]
MGIPATVSASGAVAKAQRYEGDLSLTAMPRLAQLVRPEAHAVQVQLVADDKSGYPRMHGEVSGTLPLECQRCGRAFDWPLQAAIDLRLVRDEQHEHDLLGDCDPYLVRDDQLPLRELIEDEVLLALPMLARCESCENSVNAAPAAVQEGPAVRRENPFAALKDKLKHS